MQAAVFAIQNVKPVWLVGEPVLVATTWWAQVVAVGQSIVSIFLVTMSILAMRKRFRI